MNIVFDIDGTLSNPAHRLHFIQRVRDENGERILAPDGSFYPEPDWDAFYSACSSDKPIAPMLCVARALSRHRLGNRVEFWTGRPERTRDLTQMWLAYHGVSLYGAQLFMRANDDRRPDVELKEEWLAHTSYWPDLVFEDRKRVVEMYRSRGILVLQPAEGDY